MNNPWDRDAFEDDPLLLDGSLEYRPDLIRELKRFVSLPQEVPLQEFALWNEFRSMRFWIHLYGGALLAVLVTLFTVVLYAVME